METLKNIFELRAQWNEGDRFRVDGIAYSFHGGVDKGVLAISKQNDDCYVEVIIQEPKGTDINNLTGRITSPQLIRRHVAQHDMASFDFYDGIWNASSREEVTA
ncbi:MAG: hypothetical protein AABX07_02160 [Nanoarchaeota archaeon]